MASPLHAPKMVFDEHDRLVEVIVSAEDFRTYLRSVIGDTPWDELPPPLQDAVDRLLIEDVRSETPDAVDVAELLADDGPGHASSPAPGATGG